LVARVEFGCTVSAHDTGEMEHCPGVGNQPFERIRILERALYPMHRSFGNPTRRFQVPSENSCIDPRRAQSLDEVRSDEARSSGDRNRTTEGVQPVTDGVGRDERFKVRIVHYNETTTPHH
jgi:hypothetical protein